MTSTSEALASTMAYLSKQEAKHRVSFTYWEERALKKLLHVFKGETDWIAAYDEEDAWMVYAKTVGEDVESAKREYEQEWVQLDDDQILYIWSDSPTGVCLCDERNVEQVLAHEDWAKRIHAMAQGCEMGSHLWCYVIRGAKLILPERKVTCGPNGHYKGCPAGYPGMTCRQWCNEIGRGVIASTEV